MTSIKEYPIHKWEGIKDDYVDGSLIIGNGASIALHSKFEFSSLKEEAEKLELFNGDIVKLFEEFQTTDFELILRLVWHAKLVNTHLGIVDQKIDSAYKNVREALIRVVKEVHCEHSDITFNLAQLYQFTKQFKTIVSLNYDLIMYWILMYGNDTHINDDGHTFKDCFIQDGKFDHNWERFRQPYGRNQTSVTLIFYQHGNLSIFRDAKNTENKLKSDDSQSLLAAITSEWNDEKIPLFIADGTGTKKIESIKSSPYLSTVFYEVLPEMNNEISNLVIYGWGMGDQEVHLVDPIFKGKSGGKVAISVFKNDQDYCHRIYTTIKKIAPDIEIEFYDSQSSGCWNNP